MKNIIIRNETEKDYRKVEEITREAFWNLHEPGCSEHYIAHIIRNHKDFIPELDLVAEENHKIVGNIMYTESKLVDEAGNVRKCLTFGPLTVLPDYQRKGIGKALMKHSFKKALEMGYHSIIIFGHPCNYISSGFKSCRKYNVCLENDYFPTAMLVKELKENEFDGRKWIFKESKAYDINEEEAETFDQQFPAKEKLYQSSQEEFYIYSHSCIYK